MWTALLAKVLIQTNHWIQTTDNYFSPSNPLPTTISNEDIQHFQLYGFIICQSLIWGLDILPISPFLLGLLFQDLESVLADNYIQAVAPSAARRLQSWPPRSRRVILPDGSESQELVLIHGQDPMSMIVESIESLDVC